MTIHMKSCWSPCFWHGNVKDGTYAIGVYTITISICIITYIAYMLAGGDTSMLWLPFFETGTYLILIIAKKGPNPQPFLFPNLTQTRTLGLKTPKFELIYRHLRGFVGKKPCS